MDSQNPLMVYNTLSRQKERFVPRMDRSVQAFFCGLTVYDDAHLGHAKAFINFDVVVRWIRHLGYRVTYLQNITDIDDKIIAKARERGMEPEELARYYEKRFMEDLEAIGARKQIDMLPRSHDYMETIGEQIQLLLDNGYAYPLGGDIYYDVAKFKDYTKLSGMKIDELEKHRVEPKEGKRNVYDFALWKAAKEGEPSWTIRLSLNSPTVRRALPPNIFTQSGPGRIEVEMTGRPGWHIEDTAITYKEFGPQYDLHGGASELIFPHHTNEIAQAEAAFGRKPFVKYWMHVGVFNINAEKMSKSKGNFITIRAALEGHSAEALRLLFCTTHYRKEVGYSDAAMAEAGKRLGYMYAALGMFYNIKEGPGSEDAEIDSIADSLVKDFADAMNDDFNTPLALGYLTTTLNRLRAFAEQGKSASRPAKLKMVGTVLECAGIFGVLGNESYKKPLPAEALGLIKRRESLRKEKRFAESDKIRDRLRDEYRVVVEDSPEGQKWYADFGGGEI